ncbi:agouti-related protein isoform X2 [Sminthopsis crassicaudata]|uniref:agouti-related protein isoform X2 n=1 Tax=Sminthopsis crassicaudata TaxID=9301 RepID=UPI003D68D972
MEEDISKDKERDKDKFIATMLNALLLSWAVLQGFPTTLGAQSTQQYPDAIGSRLSRSSQALYPGLLHSAPDASLGLSGPGTQPELEQMASELAEESLLQDAEALAPGGNEGRGSFDGDEVPSGSKPRNVGISPFSFLPGLESVARLAA